MQARLWIFLAWMNHQQDLTNITIVQSSFLIPSKGPFFKAKSFRSWDSLMAVTWPSPREIVVDR